MLLDNLPPEAAVNREDSPFSVRDPAALMALSIERADMWGRAIAIHTGLPLRRFDPKNLPKPIQLRPKPKVRVVTDRAEIARFFGGPATRKEVH